MQPQFNFLGSCIPQALVLVVGWVLRMLQHGTMISWSLLRPLVQDKQMGQESVSSGRRSTGPCGPYKSRMPSTLLSKDKRLLGKVIDKR
jgi:hypothetical protein